MESPSDALREVDPRILAVEKFDRFTQQRNKLRRIAQNAGEWAGLPMGVEGEELYVDPSYPWAHVFNKPKEETERLAAEGYKIRNIFWSKRYRCRIIVYEKDGKVRATALKGSGSPIDMEMRTMGCSVAWGIEQESNALKLLGTLLPHHQFKYYLLCGQFIETSRRSRVIYMFRKLRPTIAIRNVDGRLEVLATMCMHPIGFYQYSWAGAMCPTDDVIAHLMLMRGDEHLYWRRCNQHPAAQPGSGLCL